MISVRGMPDILPIESALWTRFEKLWREIAHDYGYGEIRLPIVEFTQLFQRSIGEVTDVVEKEMYTFQTKEDGASLSLRPEGTAGCVRAGLEHGLFYNQIRRLWYMGPMFRHERPQKGRYRQFHQIGLEAFGLSGADIEVEQLCMIKRLWDRLGIVDKIDLEVNTLGSQESRQIYRETLVAYFNRYQNDLDPDSLRRLKYNPLRILDSKNPAIADLIDGAPNALEYLDKLSREHWDSLLELLESVGIPFKVNPRIVRGLDYYTHTVYEWTTQALGAQGAVCAGGRYDGLVSELGGKPTPAVGCAIGMERIILLMSNELSEESIDIYVVHDGQGALAWVEKLRDRCPGIRIVVHCGPGAFKQQFKKADKSGARLALVLGEAERDSGQCGIKFLRESREQLSIDIAQVDQFVNDYFREES